MQEMVLMAQEMALMAKGRLWDILYWMIHMPCMFQMVTGLYCPGCGGTRAARYLLAGQIGKSLQYHPLVLYTAVVALLEAVSAVIAKKTGKPELYLGHEKFFIYLGVGIILLNWIVKNYLLVVKGIDLLPVAL